MAAKNPLLETVEPDVARQYYDALIATLGQQLEVKDTGDRGKGLFTTNALQPGDTILCERPLVGVQHLESKMEVSTCSHCFRAVGTVEQHVGGKICCLINELSEATEADDLQEVQDRVDKIQAAVDSRFLEGLLSGDIRLPLTDSVAMAEPVKCRGGCSEEFCCASCEAAAWESYHCLLCPVGQVAPDSSSTSDTKGKGKAPMQKVAGTSTPSSSSSRHATAGGGSSSSSSSKKQQTAVLQQVHGVTVDRAKLAEFFEHADETNDIFRVAAQVIAATLVAADKLLQQQADDAAEAAEAQAAFAAALSAAHAGQRTASLLVLPGDDDQQLSSGQAADADGEDDASVAAQAFARASHAAQAGPQSVVLPAAAAADADDGEDVAVAAQAFSRASQAAQAGPAAQQQAVVLPAAASAGTSSASPPQQQQQHLAALRAAFLPFALGHKATWWEVAAAQEGEGQESAAELAAQLQELTAESLALLAAGLRAPHAPQLFDLQLYASLVGMFELNNLALTVPAPVARYKALLLAPADAGVEPSEAAAALAQVSPLLEALGPAADEPAEGTAFYALQSTINHSCAPNAAAACLPSGQMVVTALRALPAGAEVTVSYIDEEGAEREERQAMLAEYGFTCGCERCAAEELADRLAEQQLPAGAAAASDGKTPALAAV